MQEFRITEDGFRKYRKRTIISTSIGVAIVLIFVVARNIYDFGVQGSYFFVAIPIMLCCLGFLFYLTYTKQINLMKSYVLKISDSEVIREQSSFPPLAISFMEIKSINKTKKGAFIIQGLTRNDVITVPVWVERLGEVESRLNQFIPVEEGVKDPLGARKQLAVAFLVIAATIVASAVKSPWIGAPCAAFVVVALIVAFIRVRKNKNASTAARKGSWAFLYLILLALFLLFNQLGLLNWMK